MSDSYIAGMIFFTAVYVTVIVCNIFVDHPPEYLYLIIFALRYIIILLFVSTIWTIVLLKYLMIFRSTWLVNVSDRDQLNISRILYAVLSIVAFLFDAFDVAASGSSKSYLLNVHNDIYIMRYEVIFT